jgi:hypothetical protein
MEKYYDIFLTLPNGEEEWYTTGADINNLAMCIVNLGKRGDLLVTESKTGDFVLSTFGFFLNRVASPEFREKIIGPLLRLQTFQKQKPAAMVRVE